MDLFTVIQREVLKQQHLEVAPAQGAVLLTSSNNPVVIVSNMESELNPCFFKRLNL